MKDQIWLTDSEYMAIVQKYLEDEYVQSLKNIPHHDSNRLDHSLKVSYLSYKICKKYNLNYESAAKAGLLHDFYFNRIDECTRFKEKAKLFTNDHPEDAVKNACNRWYMTPLEKDIIVSHMWPTSFHMPHHRESFIVSFADKVFSFKEMGTKLNYNLSYLMGVYIVFIFHTIFK